MVLFQAMTYVGTSGFSYDDWKGFFYPDHLTREQFFEYYAQHFNSVELNFSYYRMPTRRQMERMLTASDGRLLFAVKAHRTFTHERCASHQDASDLLDALVPLANANKLGALLLQFPHSFHQTEPNRRYLAELCQYLKNNGTPVVAEFRHLDWATPTVSSWLNRLGVGSCCVDEPRLPGLMPPLEITTGGIAYIRFHGRNENKWYQHNQPHERYDYRYSQRELSSWVSKVKIMAQSAERTMVFFNNHFQAKAVDNAKTFRAMLGQN